MGESVHAWQGLHGLTWEGIRLALKQVEMAEHGKARRARGKWVERHA